ncbi:hypothetical protein CDEST_14573 [Colletotrichum destructivum]|uniref:Uncharacterized protein n=1 Tax=Colletotrichum destructivum TaxID=34406 RepID=A0AAX4J1Y8_9PEZI|nr:hypothetical protein CDEST_14573 [Colletotrichum destructivum]
MTSTQETRCFSQGHARLAWKPRGDAKSPLNVQPHAESPMRQLPLNMEGKMTRVSFLPPDHSGHLQLEGHGSSMGSQGPFLPPRFVLRRNAIRAFRYYIMAAPTKQNTVIDV